VKLSFLLLAPKCLYSQSRQKQAIPPSQGAKQTGIISITGVKANPTDKGLEVILQTAQGEQLQVTNRSTGNNFVADISSGQLRLTNGDTFIFKSEKPLAGITEIIVTNIDANTVRVTVVGEKALPTVELFDDDAGLIFAVASAPVAMQQQPEKPPIQEKPANEIPQEKPTAQQDEPIELVVTGEQDGYRAPNASTATRTDTPIRDIPQSIQVVPRQVLEDRRVRTVTEAVETVSGVVENFKYLGSTTGGRIIRGFPAPGSIRNGFRESPNANVTVPIGTIEQVEVLKGPSSVVLGAVEPGGIINYITKQPLSTPYYKLGLEIGNYQRYQPSIDLSGPLTPDKNVLYRFIAAYERQDGFQKFTNSEITTIAPSITFKLGERTDINLYYEYSRYFANPPVIEVPPLSDGSLPPRSLFPGYPFVNLADFDAHKFGYIFTHRFNDNWHVRNNLAVTIANNERRELQYPSQLLDDRFLDGFQRFDFFVTDKNYVGQIDLLGKFKTGSVSHQLLVGFDVNVFDTSYTYLDPFGIPGGSLTVPRLDIRNPDYNAVRTRPEVFAYPAFVGTDQSYGVYLQDQIAFSDNWKLLIGGRYDWLSSEGGTVDVEPTSQNNGAFSPRIGLVYQPSKNVSLYTSYSQSFNPSIGRNPDNKPFEPTRGTQYEVGAKVDFLDGRLSATLAAYNITKTNVLTPNPDPILAQRGFQVQVGEQRSRGIELDVAGEILPGWKIIASYAYTDAIVTVDNSISSTVGNRLANVPQNQTSLWTTYEIQKGDLQGLGLGFGLFYVGARQDLANSFQAGDYLRTDAALYYRRNGFNAAVNIRNLFDIDYISSVGFGSKSQLLRGEPFTIVGSVSWEF
jgi:iron complex outermembrane recepter protein